jgi:uncharacterized protein YraI
MSTTGRRTLVAALTLAAVLIAPSVASATIFRVSRATTLYAAANTSSKAIRTIPANTRVDVRCYQGGQTVEGYSVWDRIKNGNDGFAYVHDKYVEMSNPGGPAKNGIIPCDGSVPQPPVGTCVKGALSTRFLTHYVPLQPDRSYAKLTWEPRMCLQTDGWRLIQQPELDDMPAGRTFGIGIDLESVRHNGSTAGYHGQIVACVPFSIGYSGIGFSGIGCRSVGTVDVAATVGKDGKIGTPSYKLKPKGILKFEWTPNDV